MKIKVMAVIKKFININQKLIFIDKFLVTNTSFKHFSFPFVVLKKGKKKEMAVDSIRTRVLRIKLLLKSANNPLYSTELINFI